MFWATLVSLRQIEMSATCSRGLQIHSCGGYLLFFKCKEMQPEVLRLRKTEQQSDVIYLCSHSCQHDETVCSSSNIWHVHAPGNLLTNNQAAMLTAQPVILEPFKETAGTRSLLLSVLSSFWLPR